MRVAVYGSGGHGKVVGDIVERTGEHTLVGYLDDDPNLAEDSVGEYPIAWAAEDLENVVRRWKLEGIALGIGANDARYQVVGRCRRLGLEVIPAIHPGSLIAPNSKVGEGVAVMAGAVVNPFASLEEGVVINTAASVDHDCHIHRYAHVWPGAHLAGNVEVGEFSYIGMGASVLQNVRIGRRVTVGAGAVVLRNLDNGVTAVGIPAHPVRSRKPPERG